MLNKILQQRRSKKIKNKRTVTKFESQMLPKEKRGNPGKSKSVEISDNNMNTKMPYSQAT